MTAGRIRRIQPYIGEDKYFFLTYGDGVGSIDVKKSLEFHQGHGKKLTVTAVRPPGRFGEMGVGKDGLVLEFNEKPQVTEGRINGGFFVVSRSVFDDLGEDADKVMFEQGPMKNLARKGQLMAFPHDGFWQPMDTFFEYTQLNKVWSEGKAPWKIWKT
jgi:glucose-1-phosphate cytidylyltransferase